jgi:hypothetical protein
MKSIAQVVQERGLHRKPGVKFAYDPQTGIIGLIHKIEGYPMLMVLKDGEVCGAIRLSDAGLIALPEQPAILTPVSKLRTGDVAIIDAGPCFVKSVVASEPPAVVLVDLEGDEVRVTASTSTGLHIVRPVDPTKDLPALATPDLKPMGLLNRPNISPEVQVQVLHCGGLASSNFADIEHRVLADMLRGDFRKAYPTVADFFKGLSGGSVTGRMEVPGLEFSIPKVKDFPGLQLPKSIDLGAVKWCGVERVGTTGTTDVYHLIDPVPLRGAKHRSATERQVVLALEKSNQVALGREPGNPYDKNAIAVFRKDRRSRQTYQVGYVPKELAKELAPLMDVGMILQASMKTEGSLVYDECLMDVRIHVPHATKVRGISKGMGLGDVFTHPKHEGKTVAQVLFDDPGYITWMVESGFIKVSHEVEVALKKVLR